MKSEKEEMMNKAIWRLLGLATGLAILVLCCLCGSVQGQEVDSIPVRDTAVAEKSLYMVGTYKPGKVMLRWAASSYPVWYRMQQDGVVLERYDFTADKPTPPVRTEIPVTPFLKQDTGAVSAAARKDAYAALLGEAVYSPQLQLGFRQGVSPTDWSALKAKVEQDALRFVLANLAYDRSFETALLGGMAYVDRQLQEGHYYLYRLYLREENSDTGSRFVEIPGDTAIFFTRQERVVLGNDMPVVELGLEIKDGRAHLTWPHAHKGTACVGYFVERATGSSKKFIRLHTDIYSDLVQDENRHVCYTDSLPDPARQYRYRVLARDLFGEERVIAMSRLEANTDYLKSFASIDSLKNGKKFSTLYWSFDRGAEPLVKDFSVYIASSPSDVLTGEPVVSALMPHERSCRIAVQRIPATAYLYVVAQGRNGETQVSLPYFVQTTDSVPPAPPTGLQAEVDSAGVLTLHWKPSPEADLSGYRVFFAVSRSGEPVQLTNRVIGDTCYRDTLTRISPQKFFYTVCAVDKRGNLSALSDYVPVSNGRADVPASSCFLFNCPMDEKGLQLQWENGGSANLRGVELQYRVDNSEWMLLKDFRKTAKESFPSSYYFRFPASLYNRQYEFRLMAYGEDRLRDTAYSPYPYTCFQQVVPDAPKIELTPDRDRRFVHLQWKKPERGDIKKVYIYRQKEGEKLLLLTCLSGDKVLENYWVDGRVSVNTVYRYCLQMEFSDGTWSKMSPQTQTEY